MAKTTGLGSGVGLLFGADDESEKYFQCHVDNIVPNRLQPRLHFNESDLAELSDSIRENGVIQPLIVTNDTQEGTYSLVAGERRLRASKLAGLTEVPVVVIDVESEDSLLELALIENIQRTDLNPLEEAEAYQKLINKFGYTQEETAKRVGKKRTTITNSLRLLNLPDFIKEDIISGLLSEGHGRALLRLSGDLSAIKEIRDLILLKKLSVRQTEKLVKKADSSVKREALSPRSQGPDIPTSYCKALVNQLTNKLSAKVNINQNGQRGKLEIEYYSSDDLDRLIGIILDEGKLQP